ncbi:hypothetical protein CEXT_741811 [Caerostris extrusa]|uniref:Uncharacterized protein n=1 Tax=Caerostris extrusa TaxID=172846 RepID=A0AAV4QHA5_CAEEX|nr:hypothetical protein CEXT_741811 [Caerostris extrusa]
MCDPFRYYGGRFAYRFNISHGVDMNSLSVCFSYTRIQEYSLSAMRQFFSEPFSSACGLTGTFVVQSITEISRGHWASGNTLTPEVVVWRKGPNGQVIEFRNVLLL